MNPLEATAQLARDVEGLGFGPPITHIYHPLRYAWPLHEAYIQRYGQGTREILLVGMNPGPWGMAQTGIPFGDPVLVREWLRLSGIVGKPPAEHPKRPIRGLDSPRREISGARLWGWARDRFSTPEAFFKRFFVYNYCPLCFMEESGRNFTPDKLPAGERHPLFSACDRAITALITCFRPQRLIGVGAFAAQRLRAAAPEWHDRIGVIPHPSPANPAANQNWAAAAEQAFLSLKITL